MRKYVEKNRDMIAAPQQACTLIAAPLEGDSPAGGLHLQHISLLMVVL